ncbi:hypothetical protein Tco_0023467 [Tanacetum coccineum]
MISLHDMATAASVPTVLLYEFHQVRALFNKVCWELKVFILSTAKPRVSTAQVTTASINQLVLLENFQEELFTHKEEMDLETAQTTTTTKLPILKQGEYDMWRLRIEQYFQVQDYAPWDVIENGNSF